MNLTARLTPVLFALALSATAALGLEPLLQAGSEGYHTYRIPALVQTTTGELLLFCEGRKNDAGDDGDIDLLLRRSRDNGATWSAIQVVHEEGGSAPITIGNPCPIVDAGTGRIHLLFTRDNAALFHTFSDDAGKTWSEPRDRSCLLDAFGFPWTRVGTGPGHGVQAHNGTLIAPLWLNERKGHNYRSAVLRSEDGGETWQAGGIVSDKVPDINECMVAETGKGLYLNMRAQKTEQRAIAWSRDDGKTWTDPILDPGLRVPVCQASILSVGTRKESLLYCGPAGTGRTNMTLRRSSDGGKTWSAVHNLHEGPSAYSDCVELQEGTLLCALECGKEGPYEQIALVHIPLQD
jgi:sialidase-1